MKRSNQYNYRRRASVEIQIGTLAMGGDNPIRVQSMTNTNTNDVENSVAQCARVIEAGGDLVRLTTQGLKEVDSLRLIHARIREKGLDTPLVADIHFNANVADYAAQCIEKVRINPGNYVSAVPTASPNEYTQEEYDEEYRKIETRFATLIGICKQHNTAIRIGVNHGSLSERMLLRWGNTPEGMVESCMEFLHIARKHSFSNIVISMKASNTVMMIQSVRLLVEKMDEQGFHFPIHLGVTEAGDGEDGRIKSAVGIGALLAEGIGDTIRVSLSEEPEAEIPVAKLLRDYITSRAQVSETIAPKSDKPLIIEPFKRRSTYRIRNIGGDTLPVVMASSDVHPTLHPDYIVENGQVISREGEKFPIRTFADFIPASGSDMVFIETHFGELSSENIELLRANSNIVLLLTSSSGNPVGEWRAFIHTLMAEGVATPVVLRACYAENDKERLQVKAAADLGIIFVDGLAAGLVITNEGDIDDRDIISLSFGILQAARVRVSKTEFISCPGCGRTHFMLQNVIARIKAKTSHLTGLKIGIMGCIVNGPGEMADADYGYVGAGKGRVSLYKKHECIEKNVPEELAVEKLIQLIQAHGDWKEPDE